MRAALGLRELLRVDGSELSLLEAVVAVLPQLSSELFSVANRYSIAEGRIVPGTLVARGRQSFDKLAQAFQTAAEAPPDFLSVDASLTSTTHAGSWNESAERAAQISECADFVGTVIELGSGRYAMAGAGTEERMPHPRQDLRMYETINLLLGTNLRVRDALGEQSALESADGVFEVDGTPVEMREDGLRSTSRMRTLGQLVRARESRETFAPLDEPSALRRWDELIRGGYVLLDHVDTDRRRYVVAFRHRDTRRSIPLALSERERYVLERILLGARNKTIAGELGLSTAHISGLSQRALAKLGVDSPSDLTRVLRARASLVVDDFQLGSESLVAIGYRDDVAEALARLTPAERHVAKAVLDGRSQRDIALERGVSERTVASQVASVYRKLEVSGRRELTAKLSL